MQHRMVLSLIFSTLNIETTVCNNSVHHSKSTRKTHDWKAVSWSITTHCVLEHSSFLSLRGQVAHKEVELYYIIAGGAFTWRGLKKKWNTHTSSLGANINQDMFVHVMHWQCMKYWHFLLNRYGNIFKHFLEWLWSTLFYMFISSLQLHLYIRNNIPSFCWLVIYITCWWVQEQTTERCTSKSDSCSKSLKFKFFF